MRTTGVNYIDQCEQVRCRARARCCCGGCCSVCVCFVSVHGAPPVHAPSSFARTSTSHGTYPHHAPHSRTHTQLTKRYEAAVRVCQWNAGPHQRARNVGNILEKEKTIKEQLRAEGALPA